MIACHINDVGAGRSARQIVPACKLGRCASFNQYRRVGGTDTAASVVYHRIDKNIFEVVFVFNCRETEELRAKNEGHFQVGVIARSRGCLCGRGLSELLSRATWSPASDAAAAAYILCERVFKLSVAL
eukprot:365032-Chlamydomonas_euryale.AAC.7